MTSRDALSALAPVTLLTSSLAVFPVRSAPAAVAFVLIPEHAGALTSWPLL